MKIEFSKDVLQDMMAQYGKEYAIEFSKDVLQDMMAQYGKEYAIENLNTICRIIIEKKLTEIEQELAEKNG